MIEFVLEILYISHLFLRVTIQRMSRMHPYMKPTKSVLRRREGDTQYDGQPPKAVDPNMDPENVNEVGRPYSCSVSDVLRATLEKYKVRVEEEEAPKSDRHIVFKEDRGRFFELGSPAADLRGDSRSLSDVVEVKPPTDTCVSLAAEVLDLTFEDVFRCGATTAKFNLSRTMDKYANRCFPLIGGPVSMDCIKTTLHDAAVSQLHDLIERTETRLEHLSTVQLPQFDVRVKAKERETCNEWTSDRNGEFCEEVYSHIPDAITQAFRLRRVGQKVVGFDATPKVLSALILLRDKVLCPVVEGNAPAV